MNHECILINDKMSELTEKVSTLEKQVLDISDTQKELLLVVEKLVNKII